MLLLSILLTSILHLYRRYVGGYRITDQDAMRVTIEVAGQLRTQVEQAMSKVWNGAV